MAEQKTAKKKKAESTAEVVVDEFGREEYWAGTKNGCPKHNLSIKGITFARTTDQVTQPTGSLKTHRRSYAGGIVRLTSDEAKGLRDAVKTKVVVTKGRARIALAKEFGRGSSTKPLADYLYLVRLADAVKLVGPHWRDEEPPAMSA